MADEQQVSFTSFVLIVVLGGLILRYLFFSSSSEEPSGANRNMDPASSARAREAAVELMQQMFPQHDRRTILWELQRNRGNMAATTERFLSGRIETPPITFQPPLPPPSASTTPSKPAARPAEADLITRYKLQNKINNSSASAVDTESESAATPSKAKAWSSNREERQQALLRRRDDMILAARRKMEAKIAAEKAASAAP